MGPVSAKNAYKNICNEHLKMAWDSFPKTTNYASRTKHATSAGRLATSGEGGGWEHGLE